MGDDETIRLTMDVDSSQAQVAATRTKALGSTVETTTTAIANMGRVNAATQAGTRNLGFALLEVSRAAEDAQYGVSGVLNNIPGLVMMLGGTGGIAGAVSLVAVGATVLYRNWDSISSLWKEAHTETEAQRMERLEKATHRTAEESKELAKWKKIHADADAAAATQSQYQKASGAQSAALLGVVGGDQAVKDLAKALIALDKTITKDSNPEYVEQHTKTLENRAKMLLGLAANGNIPAAEAVHQALTDTNAGRNSETGRTLATGDQDARNKANAEREQREKDDEKARLGGTADESAGALSKRFGGLYGLHGRALEVSDVKSDLLESGVSQQVADAISFDVWKRIQDGIDKKIKAYALEHGVDQATAEYQLRGKIDQRSPAEIALADANMREAQAQRKRTDDMNRAVSKRIAAEQQAVAEIEATRQRRALGVIAGAAGGGNAVAELLMQARAEAEARRAPRNPAELRAQQRMPVEDRLQAADDLADAAAKQVEDRLAAQLQRGGMANPIQARAAAAQMVNQARQQMGDPMTKGLQDNIKAVEGLLRAQQAVRPGQARIAPEPGPRARARGANFGVNARDIARAQQVRARAGKQDDPAAKQDAEALKQNTQKIDDLTKKLDDLIQKGIVPRLAP